MIRGIATVIAGAVFLFLPESNRFDLITVTVLTYLSAFYLVHVIANEIGRVSERRKYLRNLRWVRRDPPMLIDLNAKPEWPLIEEDGSYLLFQWLPKNKKP